MHRNGAKAATSLAEDICISFCQTIVKSETSVNFFIYVTKTCANFFGQSHTCGQKGVHRNGCHFFSRGHLLFFLSDNCKVGDICFCLWRSSMVAWLLDISFGQSHATTPVAKKACTEWCLSCHFTIVKSQTSGYVYGPVAW